MAVPVIQRHLPLLTTRIRFDIKTPSPPPPTTTARVEHAARPNPTPHGIHIDEIYSDDSQSMCSELSELSESSDAGDEIPKPRGEVARPGRGGYNLEHAVDWDVKQFEEIEV
jgi:hypothetical protein